MEVDTTVRPVKKRLNEYLLEGLMIFVAVSMGFFAENIRENISDSRKEKEYIHSLVVDMIYDTIRMNQDLQRIVVISKNLDSIHNNITHCNEFQNKLMSKWYSDIYFSSYITSMPTITQLESTGDYKLLTNSNVNKAIKEYESLWQFVARGNNNIVELVNKIYEKGNEALDNSPLLELTFATDQISDYPVIETDSRKLKEYSNWFLLYKGHILSFKGTLIYIKQKNREVLNLIKKEYHLAKE